MKTVEESVVEAMDGNDVKIFPYLPYILQDFWEIGSDPATIEELIKKCLTNTQSLRVLDLGSGKGAISVRLASRLNCHCHGIDAIAEFTRYSQQKASEYNVSDLCIFETADIRERIKTLDTYDVIILGAIGPVLGDYQKTFTTLLPCLNTGGIIVVDDGYIDDQSSFTHPLVWKKSQLLEQTHHANMKLICEKVFDVGSEMNATFDTEFNFIIRRCQELTAKHPENAAVFNNYIEKQSEEYHNLKVNIITSTMVFQRNTERF